MLPGAWDHFLDLDLNRSQYRACLQQLMPKVTGASVPLVTAVRLQVLFAETHARGRHRNVAISKSMVVAVMLLAEWRY